MLVEPCIFSFCSLCTRTHLLYKAQDRMKPEKYLNRCQPVYVLIVHSTRILNWEWWCLFCRDTSGQGRFCTIFRSYSRGAQVRSQMCFPVNLLHLRNKQRERERIWALCVGGVVEIHPEFWNAPPRDQQFLFKLCGMWLNRGGSLLLMWHFLWSGPYTHVIILSTMRGNRHTTLCLLFYTQGIIKLCMSALWELIKKYYWISR